MKRILFTLVLLCCFNFFGQNIIYENNYYSFPLLSGQNGDILSSSLTQNSIQNPNPGDEISFFNIQTGELIEVFNPPISSTNDGSNYSGHQISSDGNTLAVIGKTNQFDGTDGIATGPNGAIRIYNKTETDNWFQIGQDITFNDWPDLNLSPSDFPSDMTLTSDGSTVAIAITKSSGSNSFIPDTDPHVVRVYKYENSSWIQKGLDIDMSIDTYGNGAAAYVDISGDGNTVAIGSNLSRTHTPVKIFKFNDDNWSESASFYEEITPYPDPWFNYTLDYFQSLSTHRDRVVHLNNEGNLLFVHSHRSVNPDYDCEGYEWESECSGAAWASGFIDIYKLENSSWSLLQTIEFPGQDFGDPYGLVNILDYYSSISLDGKTLVVSYADYDPLPGTAFNSPNNVKVFREFCGLWQEVGIIEEVSFGTFPGSPYYKYAQPLDVSDDGTKFAYSNPSTYELNNPWTKVYDISSLGGSIENQIMEMGQEDFNYYTSFYEDCLLSSALLTEPEPIDDSYLADCIVSITNDAPEYLPLGLTNVTWTIDLQDGSSLELLHPIEFIDDTPPTAECNDISLTLENGVASISAVDLDNGSYDECGEITLEINQTDFDESHIGDNIVVLTVTDEYGNSSSCESTVTVEAGMGIEDNILANIYLYPNPTSDLVFIGGVDSELNAVVYDLLGKQVMRKYITKKIDISILEKGVYFVRLSNGINNSVHKIIKN